LSATVTPEGYSQIYHQFWISDYSPFVKYTNFYKWAKDFVNIKQKIFTGVRVNDYSHANEKMILPIIEPYMLTYTQEQAGFNYSEIQEEVKLIPTEPRINTLVNLLLANHYYKMRDGSEIVCDSAVKLQSKIHQIYSGTVKVEGEEEKARILDTSKADYIRQNYIGLKIAIFYKFVAEGQVLKNTFKNWTDTPELFNSSKDKVFICQIASGSKGINLASADVILFYNIDFSCDKYLQARQRLQTMNREKPPLVHWLFSADGIEKKIYDIVRKKRDYTLRYFAKDFLTGKGFN
jgi:SNF2 family DNA or RNA helicase